MRLPIMCASFMTSCVLCGEYPIDESPQSSSRFKERLDSLISLNVHQLIASNLVVSRLRDRAK